MRKKFDIMTVCKLRGLDYLGEAGNEIYYECPCCHSRDNKFSINLEKDTFLCFRCGPKTMSGGIFDLWEKTSTKEYPKDRRSRNRMIAKDILAAMEAKGIAADTASTAYEKPKKKSIEAAPAPDDIRDATWRRFLSLLYLKDEHKADLVRRGLSLQWIKVLGFKSFPTWDEAERIVRTLLKEQYTLAGVPGFYQDEKGFWHISGTKHPGYLCPIFDGGEKNKNGQYLILGFQKRLDNPINGKGKYNSFSSRDKKMGCSSHSPVTYLPAFPKKQENILCRHKAEPVIVTEGILKASVTYVLLNGQYSVMGVPGITSLKGLDRYLCDYKRNKHRKESLMFEAYDMEKQCGDKDPQVVKKTIRVRDAGEDLKKHFSDAGYTCDTLYWGIQGGYWDEQDKGIDDMLLDPKKHKQFIQYLDYKTEMLRSKRQTEINLRFMSGAM